MDFQTTLKAFTAYVAFIVLVVAVEATRANDKDVDQPVHCQAQQLQQRCL